MTRCHAVVCRGVDAISPVDLRAVAESYNSAAVVVVAAAPSPLLHHSVWVGTFS